MRVWLLALSVCGAIPLAGQSAGGQVRGSVMTIEGLPIAEAEIRIVGTGQTALSDSAGRFAIRGLSQGDHVVQARRIGYKSAQFRATLESDTEVKEVRIVLERGTYQLPEVVVAARQLKPIEYAWTTRFDDFFRRKQVGLGHYIMKEEIDRRGAGRTPSLLAGIRSVKLRFRHAGVSGTDVEFTGCDRVGVWIDGNKQRNPDIPVTSLQGTGGMAHAKRPNDSGKITASYLERVLPSQIEMIEVYRGPAEMPAEFIDDSCAAIAIWTK